MKRVIGIVAAVVLLQAAPISQAQDAASVDSIKTLRAKAEAEIANAKRQQTPEARQAGMVKARAQLEEIAKALPKVAATDDKAKLEVQFETAMNLYEQSLTYGDQGAEVTKRDDLLNQALKAFQTAALSSKKDPLAWRARAWLGRCYIDIDAAKGMDQLNKVIQERGVWAEPGRREAEYFRMLLLDQNPSLYKGRGDAQYAIITSAEAWMKTYAKFLDTPEGNGVRYLLASKLVEAVRKLPAASQKGQQAKEYYAAAEKIFADLEKGDSEYVDKAREARDFIVFSLSKERAHGQVSELKSFEECFLEARNQISQLTQEEKEPPKEATEDAAAKQEQKKKQHYRIIIEALNRALDLANDKTPEKERTKAQWVLTYYYLMTGQPDRAALLGEDLVRSFPKSEVATGAAAWALQGYTQVVGADERAGEDTAPGVLAADRAQLRNLADYVIQAFPAEDVADMARHQLATMASKQKNYAAAIKILSEIKPKYQAYTFAEFDLANAALQAEKEAPDAARKAALRAQAMEALKAIPDLKEGADPATSQVYFFGKLKLFNMLFSTKNFADLKTLSDKLTQQAAKARLDDKVQDTIQSAVAALPVYITVGEAEQAFNAANYAKVTALLDPLVAAVKDQKLPVQDPDFLRGVLGLCLRANVQIHNMNRAREVMDVLQKAVGDSEKGGTTGILVGLVQDLKAQVEELRKKGPSQEKELNETVANFSDFLDELAKQPKLTPDIIRFLAFSFANLGKHEKAAEQLAHITKPEKPSPAEADMYQSIRVFRARELRLAKKFEEAKAILDELGKTESGKKSLEVKKELVQLMEDQEQWIPAAKGWDVMMKALRPWLVETPAVVKAKTQQAKLASKQNMGEALTEQERTEQAKLGEYLSKELEKQKKFKEEYYDCYYHFTSCYVQNALKRPEQAKEDDLQKAVGFITLVETKQPDLWNESLKQRYDELFQKVPELKAKYDALKNAGQ